MMMVQVDEAIKPNDDVILLGDGITIGQVARDKNTGIAEALIEIGNQNKRVYK